jgi:hypothetical protein
VKRLSCKLIAQPQGLGAPGHFYTFLDSMGIYGDDEMLA